MCVGALAEAKVGSKGILKRLALLYSTSPAKVWCASPGVIKREGASRDEGQGVVPPPVTKICMAHGGGVFVT